MTATPETQGARWWNVLRFAVSRPSALPVLAHKISKRLRGEHDRGSPENDTWLASHSKTADEVASAIDPELWREAAEFASEFRRRAETILQEIPFELGGGGDYQFLYWLTKLLKPDVVVETGVAAGWTSAAFLKAMQVTGHGRLYSSDLPYFRLPDPERFVGVLVEPELRANWELHLEGDEINLPRILAKVEQADIFHYDSDKLRSGREFAVGLVRQKLAPGGLIIMDDIYNDSWFKDYVTKNSLPFTVIESRYGIIGEIPRPA